MENAEELPVLEDLVTISLAAQMLGISRQAAHRMTVSGRSRPPRLRAWRLKSAGMDRPVVVREEDVRQLLEERKCSQVITLSVTG